MKDTNFTITAPHLFSPISALRVESRLYNSTLRFNVFEILQKILSKFSISNNSLIQGLTKRVIMFMPIGRHG